MTTNAQSPRIRVKAVAQLLDCSVSTVWAWVKRGLLPPPHRVGTRFSYWLKAEIEAIAQEQGKYL